ncbi:ATPase, T2SS/T4P/T4SS family [Gorillibacterium massiliense]|uniref:ATPase, T2SS/T4P/T4SS family n=1 Tax=Gorillibacterium massiliense TaxID=1280390 RepID=UPI0004B8AE9A|nr:ATPase, T2SS/T4P/T4SS family [Gorillibacterium massiliense]
MDPERLTDGCEDDCAIRSTDGRSDDWRSTPFDVRDYLLERQLLADENKETRAARESDHLFARIKLAITDYFSQRFETGKEHEKLSWLNRQHEAVTGVRSAAEWFKREIEEFLQRNNLMGSPYPECYTDLVEAAYQETYGLGVISTWWKNERYDISQAARIIGTHVFFEIPGEVNELRPISYESEDDVLRVAKQLSLRSPNSALNPHHPSLEIDMADGTRVTIVIPPWSTRPIIIFRHYTIPKITLDDIRMQGTFPSEVLPMLRAIACGRGTTLVCGPVKSGKSTLLSALISERKPSDKMMILQKGFDELKISSHYPKHQVMELIMNDSNQKEIFELVLRSDYEYIIVGEMRSAEADIFLKGCERGLPGALSTYHTPDPDNIPSQLADLVLESHPAKGRQAQLERAARNLHFAIVMEECADRSKRLTRLTAYDWRSSDHSFRTVDLVVWDHQMMDWRYSARVPERIQEILGKYAPAETRQMIDVLTRMAALKPIGKGGQTIAS